MAEERIIEIAKMSPHDQEICLICSARDRYGRPPSLCRIALIETELDKKIQLARRIAEGKINILEVPYDCLNGY